MTAVTDRAIKCLDCWAINMTQDEQLPNGAPCPNAGCESTNTVILLMAPCNRPGCRLPEHYQSVNFHPIGEAYPADGGTS